MRPLSAAGRRLTLSPREPSVGPQAPMPLYQSPWRSSLIMTERCDDRRPSRCVQALPSLWRLAASDAPGAYALSGLASGRSLQKSPFSATSTSGSTNPRSRCGVSSAQSGLGSNPLARAPRAGSGGVHPGESRARRTSRQQAHSKNRATIAVAGASPPGRRALKSSGEPFSD